jgi:hypothetical protein
MSKKPKGCLARHEQGASGVLQQRRLGGKVELQADAIEYCNHTFGADFLPGRLMFPSRDSS